MLYIVKARGQHLSFNIFGRHRLEYTIKTKFQTLSSEICSVLIFLKGSGTSFPAHFVYDFSSKIFCMLSSINWPRFIVWFCLLLEILRNICNAIICCPGCDVISFEINHSFLINLLFHINKKSGQECKYLKNKKSI